MNPQTLLQRLDELGYRLEIINDKLRVTPPSQGSDLALIELLRTHKPNVMALLTQRQSEMTPVDTDASDFFPLSDMQQAYFLGRAEELEGGGVSSHVYHEFAASGLDLNQLESALQQLVLRHPALRTQIMSNGTQRVLDGQQLKWRGIRHHDLRLTDKQSYECELASIRAALSHQVIPIDRALWIDVQLASLPNDQQILFVSHDGLAIDGISMLLLFHDWYALYNKEELSSLTRDVNYRQYILSKEQERNSAARERSKNWWMSRIESGLPLFPQIPLAQAPNPNDIRRWSRHVSTTEPLEYQLLQKTAHANGLSTTAIVLAAWCEVLATWGAGDVFTLNVTVADRPPIHPDIYQVIGNFTSNTLLAVDFNIADSLVSRAHKLQQQLHQDLEYREFSGLEVMRELMRRDGSIRMPFTFNSTLGHGISGLDGTTQFGCNIFGISQTPQVWLNVFVMEQAGALLVQLDVVESLFPAGMLEDMTTTLQSILHQLAVSEQSWVSGRLATIPANQKKQRLASNDTASPIPAMTLYEFFLASAKLYPTQIAVRSSDHELSYAELVARSAEVAAWLDQVDVIPGKLVAVIMPKGWEQIVAILGILRAGAAYLPIDPATPPARMALLLENAQAVQVLTTTLTQGALPTKATKCCLCVDQLTGYAEIPQWHSRNQPEDLAYVIYTSGSTGNPKGVMISHRSVINLVTDINRRYGIISSDTFFGVSSFTFDLSVFDIFGAMCAGGTLVLPDQDKVADPAHWLALATASTVTIWNSVPTIVRMLVDEAEGGPGLPPSLRLIMMSGDRIPVSLPTAIRKQLSNVAIHSLGGPTETTVWNIQFPIQDIDASWVRIPYGKPNSNNRYYILDAHLQPCPDWVQGELYAAGIGNAIGYWKDPARSATSFFYHETLQERLYRTGDTGCFLPDGNIDINGRADFQIKLNGYRIETGEIETLITRASGIRECAVVLSQTETSQVLVAYITLQADLKIDITIIQNLLETQLPAWMVPPHFVTIEKMPLTGNAKIDRKTLSARRLTTVATTILATASPSAFPQNETLTQRVTSLWQRLLPSFDEKSSHDFFSAGGDSLTAARLASAIRKELGLSVSLGDLLRLRTIQNQVEHLQKKLQTKELV